MKALAVKNFVNNMGQQVKLDMLEALLTTYPHLFAQLIDNWRKNFKPSKVRPHQ